MCITFFSINPNKSYKFLILFNRDEYLSRKTLPLNFHFYKDKAYKDILFYPLDCKFEGTFLCINTKNGNFCCLLNHTSEGFPFNPDAKLKRGDIPINFCQLEAESTQWENFFKDLEGSKSEYNGFNIICGNFVYEQYYYYTNNYISDDDIGVPYKFSKPGVYGVSNSSLSGNSVYNIKVQYGKQILQKILSRDDYNNEKEFVYKLFELMGDKTKLISCDDSESLYGLVENNSFKEILEEKFRNFISSSVFVDDKLEKIMLEYGTRHTICILCDYENNLSVYEYFDEIHTDHELEYNTLTLKERNLEKLNEYKFSLKNN
jgi:uncharacterized protein with NRDE domain